MNTITVTLDDQSTIECPANTLAEGLLKHKYDTTGFPYIGCLINNDLASLSYPLEVNCTVKFLTKNDAYGLRIYRHSLTFLLAKAVSHLYPESHFAIEHSFGTGFFCSFEHKGQRITRKQVSEIEACMRRMVELDLPIERRKLSFTEAVAAFQNAGQKDKADLLRFQNQPKIITYCCDGFSDLAHGPLISSTGVLEYFKLLFYPPGLILQFPEANNLKRIPPFVDQPHLFKIFQEHKEWGRILGVNNVGKLNELIFNGEIRNFIRIEESFHEKKLARLADQIFERRKQIKVVLISGPSSAGKTTFSKRLAVQLQVNGIQPITISLDNYYVDDAVTPRHPGGRPDYEHIDAVDVALFNTHILKLIKSKEVELPYFNFETKKREYRDEKMRITDDQIIIIEGIHGLNPRFSHRIPAANKFTIYVNALTQLNIDSNNRISTTDNRLIRRLVRDHAFRKNSALKTLRMWPDVRQGELKWIFPFQKEADATFNSALDYELAVLKPLVEPLLMEVKPCDPEYVEARRLQDFLRNFLSVSRNDVPYTSLLREFIGSSSFKY